MINDVTKTESPSGRSEFKEPKAHFVVLDGLRGVAAICVVVFHFLERLNGDYSKLWIGHGFLAVDFFFCLSGFVVGYAYDDRIATMGFSSFLKARLIRLHPMVVFGALIGMAACYADPFGLTPSLGSGKLAILFAASVLLVPYGNMQIRNGNLFVLNAPSWSLFWEYVANLAFGLILYRLGRKTLILLTAVTLATLWWTGHHFRTLSGGWNVENFWAGAARVAFSFPAGLLVYRLGWRPKARLGLLALSALLLLALAMPYEKGGWIREVLIITLYFPLVVALGATAVVTPRVEQLCRALGALSYPLYMVHYSVNWIWADYAAKRALQFGGRWTAVASGTCLMSAFAWVTLKLYDEPVRRYLNAKFGLRRRSI